MKIEWTKEKKLILIITVSIIVTISSVSFAYFTASVSSNSNYTVITSGSMELQLEDGQLVTANNMLPGQSINKTFKVKNIGDIDTVYDLYFSEIINTFKDKTDLVYKLISPTGCSKEESIIPSVAGEESKMVSSCSIQVNQVHEYTLNITFKDDSTLQDDNKNQEFQAKISVNDVQLHEDIAYVTDVVNKANTYYTNNQTNKSLFGKNIINNLSIDYQDNDQVIITQDGKVELEMLKNNRCYRKEANNNQINIIDNDLCSANINGFVSNNGNLHVSGTKLLNERNEEIRLVGASGGLLVYDPIERSQESIHSLKMWGANLFRYFENANISWRQQDSYINARQKNIDDVKMVIDNAIANDMYIIITWSGVNEKGMLYSDYAVDFFTTIAQEYKDVPNVIYEIWNEPTNSNTWADVQEYANKLIPAIREIAPNSVILVGNPSMDHDLASVVNEPLSYNNIMYTSHVYMSELNYERINDVKNAIEAGIPVFVTEWGTQTHGTTNHRDIVEPLADIYLKFLDKYNISFIMFFYGTEQNEGSAQYAIVKRGKWKETMPLSLLKENGIYMRNAINGKRNDIKMIQENATNEGEKYRSSEYKDKIVSIKFKDTIEIPDNAVKVWDLSYLNDESVKGYLTPAEDDRYNLVIAANGTIYAPGFSKGLFKGLTNLKSIDFTNFSTDGAISIDTMFQNDSSLTSLDLSSFNTDNIITMYYTFAGCTNLKNLNLDGWHPILGGVGGAFNGCSNLESLDLNNFDVTNASTFDYLFSYNTKLKTVNISSWNPTSITNVSGMFQGCNNLEKVNMMNMNITDSTNITGMFGNVRTAPIVNVKNEFIANKLKSNGYNNIQFKY